MRCIVLSVGDRESKDMVALLAKELSLICVLLTFADLRAPSYSLSSVKPASHPHLKLVLNMWVWLRFADGDPTWPI